jgi:hypothetical protein
MVRAREAPGAFGDVEHRALGGAKSFVAKLGIADLRGLDGEQKLDSDVISDERDEGSTREGCRDLVADVTKQYRPWSPEQAYLLPDCRWNGCPMGTWPSSSWSSSASST